MSTIRYCPVCAFQYVDRAPPATCEGCGRTIKRPSITGTKRPTKRKPGTRAPIKGYARRAKVARLRKRDGDRCWLCGDPIDFGLRGNEDEAWSLDHVKKRADGGSNNDSNLRLAHRRCNNQRHNV